MSKPGRLIALALLVGAAGFLVASPKPAGLAAWLAEARDGDDDWGWHLLSGDVHRAYGGDHDAYLADMAGADWAALELGPPVDVWSDDGFVQVIAELRSDPATVPPFLLERAIVFGVCDGGTPIGIRVYEDRRPFQGTKFGGSGLTGGQRRCNAAFGVIDA